MAERRLGARPTVHLAYAFDRLLDAKLHNAYAILVPDQTHKIPARAQDIDAVMGLSASRHCRGLSRLWRIGCRCPYTRSVFTGSCHQARPNS